MVRASMKADDIYDATKTASGFLDNASDVTKSAKTADLNNANFASQQQMGETGNAFAGTGTDTIFRDAQNYVEKYGGSADNYVKMTSDTKYAMPDGRTFETHWVENTLTGDKYDMKTKFINTN